MRPLTLLSTAQCQLSRRQVKNKNIVDLATCTCTDYSTQYIRVHINLHYKFQECLTKNIAWGINFQQSRFTHKDIDSLLTDCNETPSNRRHINGSPRESTLGLASTIVTKGMLKISQTRQHFI